MRVRAIVTGLVACCAVAGSSAEAEGHQTSEDVEAELLLDAK